MESINAGDIISTIEAHSIKVVSIGYADLKSIELKGNLESFIATIKAFNENIVFMQEFSFDKEDFLHEPDEPILGEYDQPPGENTINLTQFLPALEDYKKYVGQTSFLFFRVFYQNKNFAYRHNAQWFEAFTKLFEEVRCIFEDKEKAIKDQQAKQQTAAQEEVDQREGYLLGLLKDLISDHKFISLKTQKAKQEYALVYYPELAELPQHILKDEISNLNARIEARKMLQ
jgi:hypothetical protein